MPLFYVQKFSYDGPGDSICYGEMGAHDHGKSNQFTTDIKEYLTKQDQPISQKVNLNLTSPNLIMGNLLLGMEKNGLRPNHHIQK